MPIIKRGKCAKYGKKGKLYCGKGAKSKAKRQARAIYASGYKSKRK